MVDTTDQKTPEDELADAATSSVHCPVCNYHLRPFRLIFQSALPFWITCPQCKNRLILCHPEKFWGHFAIFAFVVVLTTGIEIFRLMTVPVKSDVPFIIEIVAEGTVFISLLAFRLTPLYGLRPAHKPPAETDQQPQI